MISFMEKKEYDDLRKQIKQEQEEIKNSKKAAKKFLIELGVMTPDGIMKKEFIPAQ